MGVFFIHSTDEEKRNFEREHEAELREIAEETLNMVENAPNDIFPEFIWEPQINSFEMDIDYKTKAACTNTAVLRAYTIGRKYPNYWEYLDAMEAYVEYARYIESVFGSFEMMERANREGYSSVYIPPKPKLTHKKKNKLLIETGFIPSRTDPDFEPPEEIIDEETATMPECELSFDDNAELPKYVQKIQEAMMGSKARADRINGIFSHNSGRNLQGMDAIVAFLTGSSNQPVRDSDSNSSLSEQIDELHEFDGIPSEIIAHLLLPPQSTIIRNGMIENQKEREAAELIRTLELNGYNFLETSVTRGMKPAAVRALRREFGGDVDLSKMTKKQRKKYKRKMKELEADKRNALAGDRRIQRVLLQNRIHMSRDDSDAFGIDPSLVNFHLSDVLPDDDD